MGATTPEKVRSYSIQDFTRVHIQGDFKIILEQSNRSSAAATGSIENLDGLLIQSSRDLLTIKNRPLRFGDKRGDGQKPVELKVTTRVLRQVNLSGASELIISKFKTPLLRIAMQGNGKLALAGADIGVLDLGMIGNGQADLNGKSETFNLRGDGAITVNAADLTTQDAQIYWNSTKAVSAKAFRKASITAFAPGDIKITGPAACEIQNRVDAKIECGSNKPVK